MRKAHAHWRHVGGKANERLKKTLPATNAAIASTITSVSRRDGPSSPLGVAGQHPTHLRDRPATVHPPCDSSYRPSSSVCDGSLTL